MNLVYPLEALLGLGPIPVNTEMGSATLEVDVGPITVHITVASPKYQRRVICTTLVFNHEAHRNFAHGQLPLEACFSKEGTLYASRVYRNSTANYLTAPSRDWMLSFRPAAEGV